MKIGGISRSHPVPILHALRKMGEDIRTARRRRKIPTALLAERAQISRMTLYKIEKGDPGVSIAGYCAVLFSLGLLDKVTQALDPSQDDHGFLLDESRLPERIRKKRG